MNVGRSRADQPVARRVALAVVVIVLVVRMITCCWLVPAWEAGANVGAPDRYPELAMTLLQTHTLGFATSGASPTTTRGPGFAAFLAIAAAAVGDDQRLLAIWSSVPMLIVVWRLVLDLNQRYGLLPGVFAALVAGIHPLPLFSAGRLMSDDFFAATGWLAVLALLRIADGGPRRALGIGTSGFLFAVHILTRSNGVLALVALPVLALIDPRKRRACVLVGLIALAPALAWSVRTSRLEGRPVFVHSLTGYNYWIGRGYDRYGPEAQRGTHQRDRLSMVYEAVGEPMPPAGHDWYGLLTPAELGHLEPRLIAAARADILGHPLRYLGDVAQGLVFFWFRSVSPARTLQYVLVVTPLLLLALMSLLERRGRRWRDTDALQTIALLWIALTVLAYAAVCAVARYSVEVYPALAYLCGIGVYRLQGLLPHRSTS